MITIVDQSVVVQLTVLRIAKNVSKIDAEEGVDVGWGSGNMCYFVEYGREMVAAACLRRQSLLRRIPS